MSKRSLVIIIVTIKNYHQKDQHHHIFPSYTTTPSMANILLQVTIKQKIFYILSLVYLLYFIKQSPNCHSHNVWLVQYGQTWRCLFLDRLWFMRDPIVAPGLCKHQECQKLAVIAPAPNFSITSEIHLKILQPTYTRGTSEYC